MSLDAIEDVYLDHNRVIRSATLYADERIQIRSQNHLMYVNLLMCVLSVRLKGIVCVNRCFGGFSHYKMETKSIFLIQTSGNTIQDLLESIKKW